MLSHAGMDIAWFYLRHIIVYLQWSVSWKVATNYMPEQTDRSVYPPSGYHCFWRALCLELRFFFYLNIPWSAGLCRSSYFSVDRFQSLVWFVFSFDPQHFCSSLWVVVLLVVCLLSPRPTDPFTQHNQHKMRNWEWKKGNDFLWWKTGLPCNKYKHRQISTWWPNWGECISINKWTRHHTMTERVNSRLIYCIFGIFYLGHR